MEVCRFVYRVGSIPRIGRHRLAQAGQREAMRGSALAWKSAHTLSKESARHWHVLALTRCGKALHGDGMEARSFASGVGGIPRARYGKVRRTEVRCWHGHGSPPIRKRV